MAVCSLEPEPSEAGLDEDFPADNDRWLSVDILLTSMTCFRAMTAADTHK